MDAGSIDVYIVTVTNTAHDDLSEEVEAVTLSPEGAFSVLGDQTRLKILQTLGEADGALSFSELFERIQYDDTANFSYHLEKLRGHFICETDAGYDLRQAGHRIVQAVLSGAMTEEPVIEPTQIDRQCPRCGSPIEVGYSQETIEQYCTACDGIFGEADPRRNTFPDTGHLGNGSLPPAGVQGRTATEVAEIAWTWGHLAVYARGSGFCPNCSAPTTLSMTVCEDHDGSIGTCERCDRRYAVQRSVECTNCIYESEGNVGGQLLSNTELLAFFTTHGLNPLTPETYDRAMEVMFTFKEEVISASPFRGRYTYNIDGDSITLTVDEDLSVVGVERKYNSDSA